MKPFGWKRADSGWRDSVLECCDLSPLSLRVATPPNRKRRQVSAVQTLARRCGLLTLLFAIGLSIHAQNFAIDWFTIDGGGGTSRGGVYSVSGTIGQPDAGPMKSGGNFSVDGGFWSFLTVVQTPGAPLLTITLTSTNTALVSWPSPSTGFTLQQNTNGGATVNWSNVATTPSDDGTTKTVIVNPPTGNRFYRFIHP